MPEIWPVAEGGPGRFNPVRNIFNAERAYPNLTAYMLDEAAAAAVAAPARVAVAALRAAAKQRLDAIVKTSASAVEFTAGDEASIALDCKAAMGKAIASVKGQDGSKPTQIYAGIMAYNTVWKTAHPGQVEPEPKRRREWAELMPEIWPVAEGGPGRFNPVRNIFNAEIAYPNLTAYMLQVARVAGNKRVREERAALALLGLGTAE
jgi:hypothetical protein